MGFPLVHSCGAFEAETEESQGGQLFGSKLLSRDSESDSIGDTILRLGVALFFDNFGLEKFSSAPGSHWVQLFDQIGMGDWFRHFTGVVEILGAVLVLIPRIVLVGLALLAVTMACAALILAFAIHTPGDSAFPTCLFSILVVIGLFRLNR